MNIKIGKGGSGKINSTKGGSGKLIEKKYIDLLPSPSNLTFLFDPIFYKKEIQNERCKVLVSDCSLSYVNGIYSQTVNPSLVNNRPAFTKDDDADMQIFEDGAGAWVMRDSNQRNNYYDLFIKNNDCSNSTDCRPDYVNWNAPDGGDAVGNETPPTITLYFNSITDGGADLDPVYLEELRNYQLDGIIPTFPNLNVRQKIPGSSFNSRKAEFANNTYRYIKYDNNNDVEHLKGYGKLVYTTVAGGVSAAKGKNLQDLNKPLLTLRKNNSTSFITTADFTFNTFVKLQRPIAHTSPTNYLVREKRGLFARLYGGIPQRDIHIGYRSPYYNINGDNTYKLKFEPFSFVFSLGQGWTSQFGFGNFTLMTDYKYKFGEMYMLSITKQSGEYKIYINGELETTAMLRFNPCYIPQKDHSNPTRQTLSARLDQTPLAPGFLKKNGLVYPTTATSWTPENVGTNYNFLFFGQSRRGGAYKNDGFKKISFKRKRFLNNLDIGVTNSYNVALSQTQILQMYNNFRYRYL
jgi:hypothetical protein